MRVELTKNGAGDDRFEIRMVDSDRLVYVQSIEQAEKLARWIFELLPGGNPLAAMQEAVIRAPIHSGQNWLWCCQRYDLADGHAPDCVVGNLRKAAGDKP